MFYSIKFFIRDTYYAIINRLWRKLYQAEHYRFVEEYLREQVSIEGTSYWHALIDSFEKEEN